MNKVIVLLGMSLLIFGSCKNYFIAHNFEQKTANHRTIAILPLEMIFTGNTPKNLTAADIAKIEEGESKAFMISLYNEILRSTRGGNKPLRVDIQNYVNTLSILEAEGIDIRQSWKISPTQLATVLGVDAVVQGSITKKRYMSDLASFGVDLGTQILDALSGGVFNSTGLPNQATRTNDIRASYSLIGAGDGTTLFSQAFDYEADWNNTSEDIIMFINRRFSRNFPYRSK